MNVLQNEKKYGEYFQAQTKVPKRRRSYILAQASFFFENFRINDICCFGDAQI